MSNSRACTNLKVRDFGFNAREVHWHLKYVNYVRSNYLYTGWTKKKLYPPTFWLTPAMLFKLTEKFLWIMTGAGSDDINSIKWTTQMIKLCVEKYFEVKRYKAVREDFMTYFSNHEQPYKSLIIYRVSKFRPFGTVENFNRKIPDRQRHSGRERIRGGALKDRVRESVADWTHRFTLRRYQELEISW